MTARANARATSAVALAALALAGCAHGIDVPPPGPSPVPAAFPTGAAYLPQNDAAAPRYAYAQVLADPRLVAVIDAALAHNQDIAVAVANIAAARAQYRIQRAALLPNLDATAGVTHTGGEGGTSGTTGSSGGGTGATGGTTTGSSGSYKGEIYYAQGSVPAYEVDLFGRLQSLTAAARARYLASEATARATRLTLVGEVADGWLQYGADASLLTIAQQTATAARTSVALTTRRVDGGIAPLSDQRQAELVLNGAEADVAGQTNALAQDVNNLRLLVGADTDAALLPTGIADATARLTAVTAGIDSSVLLRRPDIIAADQSLRAANGNLAAARAALFPKITLTGLAGVVSTALSSLFTAGAFSWSAGAAISYPIFDGGAARANVRLNAAQRDAALAMYRKAVQSAFTDAANALARAGTIDAQVSALTASRFAAADNNRLANERYLGGVTSYLEALTAEQALYTSQKALVAGQLTRGQALVGLYRSLGGDTPGEMPVAGA